MVGIAYGVCLVGLSMLDFGPSEIDDTPFNLYTHTHTHTHTHTNHYTTIEVLTYCLFTLYSVTHLIQIHLIRISGYFKAISISLPNWAPVNSKALLFGRYFHSPQLQIKWVTVVAAYYTVIQSQCSHTHWVFLVLIQQYIRPPHNLLAHKNK